MTSRTFGAAYSTGVKRTISFLEGRGVPRDTAEDVAQTAWFRGWQKLEQLRDDAMVVPWVNTIALNTYRRAARRVQWEQPWNPLYVDLASSHINCAAIEVAEILKICSPADRHLLKAEMSGVTPRELAEQAGVTHTAMRIRLHRARRKARALCQPRTGCEVHQAAA
jgi:RNA polymerase sigma-70 factor (ECF subfamily)